MVRLIVVFTVLLSTAGCTHSDILAETGSGVPPVDQLELAVANAVDPTMTLPGVQISLVTTDGAVDVLGETDRFGTIDLPKSLLTPDRALVITACARWFYCGAIFIEANELSSFDEYFLTLAPITVRSS